MPLDPQDVPPPETAVDAVCGARVRPDAAPMPVLFRGARWWFCSPACRLAFKRAPDRHADARPDAGVAVRPVVPPVTRAPGPFRVAGGPRPSDASESPDDEGGGAL